MQGTPRRACASCRAPIVRGPRKMPEAPLDELKRRIASLERLAVQLVGRVEVLEKKLQQHATILPPAPEGK